MANGSISEWTRNGDASSTVGNYPSDAHLGGNKFYFSRAEADNKVLLFIEADPEKKTERVILRQSLDQPLERIAYVSPDGKTVFTTSMRNAGSDTLLVEGVR